MILSSRHHKHNFLSTTKNPEKNPAAVEARRKIRGFFADFFNKFRINDRTEIESMYDLDVLHRRTNEISAFGNGPPANGLGDLTPSAKMIAIPPISEGPGPKKPNESGTYFKNLYKIISD